MHRQNPPMPSVRIVLLTLLILLILALIVDPNTSIPFPKTIHVPSRSPIPDLSLIGVGVRTVSFLRIKVYSVAFYADLNNPALQVGTSFLSKFAQRRPMDRCPIRPLRKRKLTTLSETRPVLFGSFLRGVLHTVIFVTAS